MEDMDLSTSASLSFPMSVIAYNWAVVRFSTFVCMILSLSIFFGFLLKILRRKLQAHQSAPAFKSASTTRVSSTRCGLCQVFELVKAIRNHHFLDYLQLQFKRFGNTFVYITFGAKSIWTIEPENIQACLSTQSKDFGIDVPRINALMPLLGRSIFTSEGSVWANHRAMIRPNFIKSQYPDLSIFEKHFSNLVNCFPKDDSTFDLRVLLQKFTMDISTDFLLGCSTNSLVMHSLGEEDSFTDAWNVAISWLPLRCYLGAMMNWVPHPSFFKACKTVHAFADQLVKLALSHRDDSTHDGSSGRYIFLYELAKEITDPVQLRDHAISILSAGRDTTAEWLACTINLLTSHPAVFARLREEVDQLGGQKPTIEILKNMKYLKNILLEALRLYPIAPVNACTAFRDTTLPVGGGPDGKEPIVVQKGQEVLYCVYGLQRRKDLYGDDADEFVPTRWENRKQGGWDYLPFNGGSRNCIGQNFATTEASYVLVRLMQEFETIEGRNNNAWREHLGLILENYHGTLVGLTRRNY